MTARRFAQVDVLGAEPLRGSPVAVIVDGIEDAAMAEFARRLRGHGPRAARRTLGDERRARPGGP
ncbi:hypothetical protein C5C31_14655 [Rathayibacter rathayi]|nr:hypothetical protein C5C08_11010 [Rathayibacter rathayi]PPH17288.1 hypothetical protein C5C31_14655 [Rathayibacter rathayi]PPI64157.1 hypothetical protein C5E02_03585 [Rathayibacter rathayi]